MTIQYSDVSGYAIIVLPKAAIPVDNSTDPIPLIPELSTIVSLYHWRHVLGARESSEIENLHSEYIKPCPTIDNPDDAKRSKWVYASLGPAFDALSIRVPKGTTVAICLPEAVAVLTDYPRDVVDVYCKNYSGGRKVKLELAVLTGPLDQVFTAPARPHEYMAVYTVHPENVVRIYDRSQSVPKLIHTSPIEKVLDVSTEEGLEERVIAWVDSFLRPALDFTVDSTPLLVQLYVPTKDLCANPFNDYNSVRDQIITRLRANPPIDVTVTLAGSTDNESPLTILDRVFADHKSHLLASDKYLVTIDHKANTATVFVDHRSATTAKIIFRNTIDITDNNNDSDAIKDVFTRALGTFRDSMDDMTPFVVLFVRRGGTTIKNDWFYKPARTYWGTGQTEWLASVALADSSSGDLDLGDGDLDLGDGDLDLGDGQPDPDGGHDEDIGAVIGVVFNHVVVVDAGSNGTRASVYDWLLPAVGFEAVGPNGPFPHPQLPYVRLVGQCANNAHGIHTIQAVDVPAYLDNLFTPLQIILDQNEVNNAETRLFVLATGGMRSRLAAEELADPALALYNALINAINAYFQALALADNHFQLWTFDVATGNDEAMYGWISANYSLGRLDLLAPGAQGPATKGFLEMGGASMQVAYQVPDNHNGGHMRIVILGQEVRVFTMEIENLGANTARERYVAGLAGENDRNDPCWSRGYTFPRPQLIPPANVIGTGLCLPGFTLARNPLHPNNLASLRESLDLVTALLPAPFRPVDHNGIVAGTEFAGGAGFWHVSKALYPPCTASKHTFNKANISSLIIAFAQREWATIRNRTRQREMRSVRDMTPQQVHLEVAGADGGGPVEGERTILVNNRTDNWSKVYSNTLFCALVVCASLYDGVGLAQAAQFQPFNGVIGVDAHDAHRTVPYSWTLGRAVVSVIGAVLPEFVE